MLSVNSSNERLLRSSPDLSTANTPVIRRVSFALPSCEDDDQETSGARKQHSCHLDTHETLQMTPVPFSLSCRPSPSLEGNSFRFQAEDSAIQRIQVYLRIRRGQEFIQSDEKVITVVDPGTVILQAPKNSHSFKTQNRHEGSYKFSQVFDENVNQQSFFETAMLPTVQEILMGKHRTIAAFGVTNSGKTYTIQGTLSNPGILPRAISVLFQAVDDRLDQRKLRPTRLIEVEPYENEAEHSVRAVIGELPLVSRHSTLSCQALQPFLEYFNEKAQDMTFSLWISCIECYNEKLYDLFIDPPKLHEEQRGIKRKVLEVRQLTSSRSYVDGGKLLRIHNYQEAMFALDRAYRNRQVHATSANSASSRSHCMTFIYLVQYKLNKPPRSTRFLVIDLAGSERQRKTQAEGNRMKEASDINRSLSSLHSCITAIRNNQHSHRSEHIPIRNSRLTQILAPEFLGAGSLVLIANVSLDPKMFDETTHALEFCSLAFKVKKKKVLEEVHTNLVNNNISFEDYIDGDDGARKESNASQLSLASKKSSKEGSRTCPNCSYFEAELFRLQQELTNTENDVRTELIQTHETQLEALQRHYEGIMHEQVQDAETRLSRKMDILCRSYEQELNTVRKRLSCVQEQNHSLQSKHEQELVSVYEQHKLELERTVNEYTELIDTEREYFKALTADNHRTIDVLRKELDDVNLRESRRRDADAMKRKLSDIIYLPSSKTMVSPQRKQLKLLPGSPELDELDENGSPDQQGPFCTLFSMDQHRSKSISSSKSVQKGDEKNENRNTISSNPESPCNLSASQLSKDVVSASFDDPLKFKKKRKKLRKKKANFEGLTTDDVSKGFSPISKIRN